MKQIDHNRHERRMTNRIWWFWLVALPLMWAAFLFLIPIDWPSVALGVVSGMIPTIFALETFDRKRSTDH